MADECGNQVDDARADTLAAQVLVSLSGRSSADDFSQVCLPDGPSSEGSRLVAAALRLTTAIAVQMRAERDLRDGHTAQSPLAGHKRHADSLQVRSQ